MKTSGLGFDSQIIKNNKKTVKNSGVHSLQERVITNTHFQSENKISNGLLLCHLIRSTTLSFIVPLGFYSAILLPTTLFVSIYSFQFISMTITAPIFTCVLSPLFIPLDWPEQYERQRINPTNKDYSFLSKYFIFMKDISCFRFAVARHFCLSLYILPIFGPLFFTTGIVLGPMVPILFFIIMSCTYISSIAFFITPITLIMFSFQKNHDRIMHVMKKNNNKTKQFVHRIINCPKC